METLARLNKEILNPLASGNYGVLDKLDISLCTSTEEREFYMNISTILNNNLLMLNNNDMKDNIIEKYKTQLFKCQKELKQLKINKKNVHIKASANLTPIPISKILAKHQPVLAWYYYLHGYDPNVCPEPIKLIEVRKFVDKMGDKAIRELLNNKG